MQEHKPGHTLADLAAAAAIQGEIAQHPLLFEWGQSVFAQLLWVWMRLETDEMLAYEDKVAAQVHTLDEATTSLWHLYKALYRSCQRLKRHQQDLRQPTSP